MFDMKSQSDEQIYFCTFVKEKNIKKIKPDARNKGELDHVLGGFSTKICSFPKVNFDGI